jgi:large subunit ribosomal protein L37Ae
MVPRCESRLKKYVIRPYFRRSLQPKLSQMEITQHARYTCTFCGKVSTRLKYRRECLRSSMLDTLKDSVKRTAVGIWNCSSCKKVIAGGAWTVSTTAAATVRRCVIIGSISVRFPDRGLSTALFVGCGRSPRHRSCLRCCHHAFLHLVIHMRTIWPS